MPEKKAVFVLAPSCFPTMPPLAPPSLCALVKSLGHEAVILDLNVKLHNACSEEQRRLWISAENQDYWLSYPNMRELFRIRSGFFLGHIHDILSRKPDFIAFSIWFTNANMSLVLAEEIKRIAPSVPIVFGGPEVTRMNYMRGLYSTESLSCVDLFVKGEGEPVIRELLDPAVNACHPDFSEKISFIPELRLAESLVKEDLDALPAPDFTSLDLGEYTSPGLMPLSTSRGCINRCIFCDEAKLWGGFRNRSAGTIFRDVAETKRRHPDLSYIDFGDSLINGNIKALREFSTLMAKSGLEVGWGGNAVVRPEMDGDLLRVMAAGGCKMLIYGLETASSALFPRIGKFFAVKADPNKVIRETFEAGIESQVNFMFGLPGETEEDALCNISFLRENMGFITRVVPSFAFCNICPGTPAHDNPGAYGIRPDPNPCFWESTDGGNTYPVRMARFERFVRFVHENGIPTNYPYPEFLHKEKWLANYHIFKNDLETAAVYLKEAVLKEPEETSLRRQLRETERQMLVNRTMEKARQWDEYGDVAASELVSLGEELFGKKDIEEAMLVFCKVLAREPDNTDGLNNLGVVYLNRGEDSKARMLFERCLSLDPRHSEASKNIEWLDSRNRIPA